MKDVSEMTSAERKIKMKKIAKGIRKKLMVVMLSSLSIFLILRLCESYMDASVVFILFNVVVGLIRLKYD